MTVIHVGRNGKTCTSAALPQNGGYYQFSYEHCLAGRNAEKNISTPTQGSVELTITDVCLNTEICVQIELKIRANC
jgi:hypothetical protein